MKMTVKQYVDNILLKEIGIPYVDVSVTKNGNEIYRYFNKTNGNATGKEMLKMYSMSKVITAVATLTLIEQNAISLDDKVSKYLPCFNNVYLIKNGKKVKPQTDITIKHLLSMSAGLNYNTHTEFIDNQFKTKPDSDVIDIIEAIVKSPLDFEPNERYGYSLCFDVLAGVIQVVTGKKFSDYIEQTIFAPLDMKNSTFKYYDGILETEYKVKDNVITISDLPDDLYVNHKSYECGGAGLKCTIDDYQKFSTALALGKILKPETVDLLTTPMSTKFINNTFGCPQGKDYEYGLGVRVRKVETNYGLPVGEFGWDGAAGSFCLIDRVNKVSIVVGMDLRGWPNLFKTGHIELVELIYKTVL